MHNTNSRSHKKLIDLGFILQARKSECRSVMFVNRKKLEMFIRKIKMKNLFLEKIIIIIRYEIKDMFLQIKTCYC